MCYPHSIRLRGPWRFEPLSRSVTTPDGQVIERCDDLPPAGRHTVPCDWEATLGASFRGRVRYRRSFNPPATLDPHERLWLVVEGVDARGAVSVNGAWLGDVPGYAVWRGFDITRLVERRNEIVLDVELLAGDAPGRPGRERLPGGPIGEVRLEVRSTQFLEGLAVWSCGEGGQPHLAVRGRVGGEPTRSPLAIVVGAGERELAYLEPQHGDEFEATFPAGDLAVWTPASPATAPVEVKLLQGGSSAWRNVVETAFRAAWAGPGSVRLDAILGEADYRAFDRDGTTIVQHVPRAWIEQACPRLAHHPSIVAWSAGEDGKAAPAAPTFGRPWI